MVVTLLFVVVAVSGRLAHAADIGQHPAERVEGRRVLALGDVPAFFHSVCVTLPARIVGEVCGFAQAVGDRGEAVRVVVGVGRERCCPAG